MAGFTYDGIDLARWLLPSPSLALTPSLDITTQELPGRDGLLYMGQRLGTREISVFVRILAPRADRHAVAEARRMLTGVLVTDTPRRLTLPDQPDVYWMAKLASSSTLDDLWYLGGTTLKFVCYDPAAYGRERSVSFTGTYTSTKSVNVRGTYPTWPTFRLTASSTTKPYLKNSTTGEVLKVTSSVTAGAVIVVDMAEQLVTVDGQRALLDLSSDFWRLGPGVSSVYLYYCKGTMTYRERWV